jgi:hypothetical protein
LLQENRELRKEVANLRRQVEPARGLQQHQPYALPPVSLQSVDPLPQPLMGRTRTVGELTPEHRSGDDGADTVMRSPPAEIEPKRVCRSLATSLGDAALSAVPDPRHSILPYSGVPSSSDGQGARADAAPGDDVL